MVTSPSAFIGRIFHQTLLVPSFAFNWAATVYLLRLVHKEARPSPIVFVDGVAQALFLMNIT